MLVRDVGGGDGGGGDGGGDGLDLAPLIFLEHHARNSIIDFTSTRAHTHSIISLCGACVCVC